MVPPVLSKSGLLAEPVLRLVWTLAFETLTTAKKVTFIGYSFPSTDLAARTLFPEALRDLPRENIRVVDLATEEADIVRFRSRYRGVLGEIPDYRFSFDGAGPWIRTLVDAVTDRHGYGLPGPFASRSRCDDSGSRTGHRREFGSSGCQDLVCQVRAPPSTATSPRRARWRLPRKSAYSVHRRAHQAGQPVAQWLEYEIPLRRVPFSHGGHNRDYSNARHTVFSGYRKALARLAAGRIPLDGMVRPRLAARRGRRLPQPAAPGDRRAVPDLGLDRAVVPLSNRPFHLAAEMPRTTPEARVQQVAHGVAEHVEAVHGERQAATGPEGKPWRHFHVLAPLPAEHASPARSL